MQAGLKRSDMKEGKKIIKDDDGLLDF